MGYLTTTFLSGWPRLIPLVVFAGTHKTITIFARLFLVCWLIMKTLFIDINKLFGLCSMYLFILMIMIVICRHLWLPKIKRFGPKWCKVTSYYHKNQDSKTLFLEFQFQLELALLISSIFSLTLPPPLHSNLQSLLGITNKSLNTYTILEKQIKKRVERIQIELLYFPISYTERCGTCMTTLETVLKIETEKKLRKIKIRFFGGWEGMIIFSKNIIVFSLFSSRDSIA